MSWTFFFHLLRPVSGHRVASLRGFDTLYFWLREDPQRWREDLVYFEVGDRRETRRLRRWGRVEEAKRLGEWVGGGQEVGAWVGG